jgi:murein DD-endopeptidase MepM/ murein hydrolase activator NlpD
MMVRWFGGKRLWLVGVASMAVALLSAALVSFQPGQTQVTAEPVEAKLPEVVVQQYSVHETTNSNQYPRKGWIHTSDYDLVWDVKKSTDLVSILKTAQIDEVSLKQILDVVKKQAKDYKALGVGSQVKLQNTTSISSARLLAPRKISIISTKRLELTLNKANSYSAKIHDLPVIWQAKVLSGTIKGSLNNSLRNAGAGPNTTREVAALFSADAELQKSIRAGAPFKVMYEYQTDRNGKTAKEVKIIYASVGTGGKAKEFYRHADASKNFEYYDKKGHSVKRALLSTPINGAKITSHYGYRMHPVLHCNRMHEGLDYSAPKGTPVLAAGDGVVTYAKHQSGYGKHVEVKHNAAYSTLYAHLSRFATNLKSGTRVKQGQVIGYVGATGLASGPHLHYEVIHNGRKVNPAKTKPQKYTPLTGKELAKFKDNIRKVDQMVAELDGSSVGRVAMSSVR